MSELKKLTELINQFVADRDWDQFQNPKDLAISIALEAGELLEHFQWKNLDEVTAYLQKQKTEVADELADVLVYVLRFAHQTGINLEQAVEQKMEKNAIKYPVDKARGNHKKYSEL